jgi:hypothetical protein
VEEDDWGCDKCRETFGKLFKTLEDHLLADFWTMPFVKAHLKELHRTSERHGVMLDMFKEIATAGAKLRT